ncbi:unnamed protein product [Blepharisma stoltei]|uniref:Tyrosine decarboxylase n=1 Tax=Blepharisma stoltei TaxID=1481888 RepID=A0AAU9J928_9CILI|nr:unnamed protein product [Blepharisma stoltei]
MMQMRLLNLRNLTRRPFTTANDISDISKARIDKFKNQTHELIEQVAEYHKNIASINVKPDAKRNFLRKLVSSTPPAEPVGWETIQAQIKDIIIPNNSHWQHPMYMSWFPSISTWPAIQGEILSRSINAIGFSWDSSPLQTELELLCADWYAQMMGFPDYFLHEKSPGGGMAMTSAGDSVLNLLIVARHRRNAKKPVIYVSDQTHVHISKCAKALGYETRVIPSYFDEISQNYPMNVSLLPLAIKKDIEAGLDPIFACGTFGTTNSTAIDPIQQIGQICKENNMWLHIDAAYAGSALVCPEFRHLFKGVEYADSIVVNASKWMGLGFCASYMFIRDKKWLGDCFTMDPDYLRKSDDIDLGSLQLAFGRDNRALRMFFYVSQYGVSGVQSMIRKHVELAKILENLIKNDDRFEFCTKREFALLVFRMKGDDQKTTELIGKLKERKDIFVLGTKLEGRPVIRLSMNSEYLEEEHIHRAWEIIASLA